MDEAVPAPEGHHHETARQRQRRGPMWGCLRWLIFVFGGMLVVLFLVIGGGWFYLGTSSFAGLVQLRIQKTLEDRLGRAVWVGPVKIERTRLGSVIIDGIRIANSPGAVNPYFATVKQLTITGGIDSFWGRRIKVSRIDVVEPHLFFEIYPAGSKLVHNFPHWNTGPKSKYDIYHLDLGEMFITNGAFDFLDRKHDITAVSRQIASQITITSKEDLYAGVATSPLLRTKIQTYAPFDTDLHAQFRYTPGILELTSVGLNGPNMRVFVNGKLDPLTDGVYKLRVRSEIGLDRVRQIFGVQRALEGPVSFDANLNGRQGTFTMAGGWVSPRMKADVYELANARGTMKITDSRATVDVERATYGGGTVTAHYLLPQYSEPYPMSVDLQYNGVSVEKLFTDWGIEDTGLRGGATGRLTYHWNKDRILAGGGEGTARLAKNTTAFSHALYPVPVAGATDFALDNGVITFRKLDLATDASQISATGKLRIADVYTDLLMKIHSSDFAELDRIGYNFAHSAGKKTYTLLGLGGAGDISGSMRGKIKTPQVVAKIAGTAIKYNNVLLGDGDIDLRYDGDRSVMTFDRALFREANGRLALSGTVTFPDRGPSPVFDLAIDATNYPVDRAVATVNLKLAISGLGTGRVVITGNPDAGKVTFAGLTIRKSATSSIHLNGTTAWAPGKGNVEMSLDIDAQSFPVADIVKFLDLGTVPVAGDVTGKLHLEGPKSALEGSGAITIRNGTLYGEPVTTATATIAFTKGTMRATNVNVVSPAGTVTGQAEFNLSTNQFNYSIQSSSIDLSKVKVLSSLAGMLGGNLTLTSTGAGTLDQPEAVLNATLNQATLRGLNLPPGSPPPQLYIAIRNGQLIVKGSAADILTIDGTGSVAADGTLSGNVQIRISDLARAVALSPNTAALPAAGKMTVNLQLGGKMSSLEALRIDATFPEFDVSISEHRFSPARPLHVSLRDGRIVLDDFQLALEGTDSQFAASGYAGLTGTKALNVTLNGTLEAALLELFVPGSRAEGHVAISGGIHGTMDKPLLSGTAELRDAQVRFPGFPQLIDHITGTLIFRGDRVDIDSLKMTLGGGTVTAGGSIALSGMTPQSARLRLVGEGVTIRYFEGLTIEGDFNLALTGATDRMALDGDVNVTRALYFRDVDIGAALLNAVLLRRGVTPIVSASWQDKVHLNVHLVSNGTLAIRNNIADVTGSGDLTVAGTLANPAVIGNVTFDEGGRVRFQNIDYTLAQGSISFQNPFRIDPYFDITLEGRLNGGFTEVQESGPIEVTVNITGTVDRITPTITSDPPASDITLFSLVGLGSLGNQSTANQTPTAQAGRSLLYTSFSRFIGSKVLPFVDTFTFDPSSLDTTGESGPKVTFEKRLRNNISLVVVYYMNDHRKREMIDWQINPEWALQFIRDELRNEYRTEARYRRPYEGHWSWGSRGRNPMTLFSRLHEINTPVPAPASVAQAAPATTLPPPTGAIVAAVNFRSDAAFDTSTLANYVTVKRGVPLSIREVQNSIKSLYATGDFRDIRVETTQAASGVNVTFALFINYRVATIRIVGLRNADRDRASRDLTLHTGDVFSDNAVEHSSTAIQDFLNRAGYLEASVDSESNFVREQGRANVTFTVAEGPRAKVGSVVITGDVAPFTPAQLIDQMRRGPGKTYTINDARLDAERMERFMIRRDYRKADVRYAGETYDHASDQVTLQYRATSGPVVKVTVDGAAPRAVRRLLPFRKNQAYSEDVIDRAANDAIVELQRQGYYNAAVDTDESLNANTWTITFRVRPGQQYHLTSVAFTGNATVPDKKLAEVVATSPSGGFRSLLSSIFRHPTGVTRSQLTADRDAIESFYRLNGYSIATVATPVVNTKADGTMTVNFPITEGPQTIVAAVGVEGSEQVRQADLPELQLKPGQPLNPQLERADMINLQTFYGDRGNAEVQIKPREEISADKKSAKVTYVVAEGPKINVGEVIVRGNTYTNTNVILRSSDLEKGQPFSYTSILEAQRNLYRLGIFQRVDVQPEDTGTSVSDRNVVISVTEGKDLTVAGALGGSFSIDRTAAGKRFSAIVEASIAHRNLFGTGRYVGLQIVESQAGDRSEHVLTYREPAIGRFDIPVQFSIFNNNLLRRGAQVTERGVSVEASKVAYEQTRWSLRYEYRLSDCKIQSETPPDVCALLKKGVLTPGLDRTIGKVNMSSLTPTFFWDKRDDPLNPTRGFFTSASLEWAFPISRADADLLKQFAQASWYLPLTQRSVFAVAGRVGMIHPFGGRPVPLTELFTAGGDTSHRAYGLDLLGTICPDPNDTGCRSRATLVLLDDGTVAPIGGNSVVIANAEYRFPIFSSVGGAVFLDAGNTFASSAVQLGKLRYGVGAGIRYLSPVGPLRFDFGYKLKRQITGIDTTTGKATFERPYAYFITIGYPF